MMKGESDVLWNGRVKWFSKSSGTTSEKSKFIPVSKENLNQCHIKGNWDAMTFFYDQRSDARQFECKSIVMGGSMSRYPDHSKTLIGDVSAIMMHNMPNVAKPFFTPDLQTAMMADLEAKIEKIAQITSQQKDIVLIGGVPTWTIVLFRRILELTGKDNILEVWPDLQGYIHGGVSFLPYASQFEEFLPGNQVSYQEVYNASEGFFAAQADFEVKDMTLLLDNGVFYEFVPMSEIDKENPTVLQLGEVECGIDYAMLISTNSGLWRYKIGDCIQFTSLYPYKIKISGRTKQYINVFGEELMVHNADKALSICCKELDAEVEEYTAGPIYFQGNGKGGHEWIIEFKKPPLDAAVFARLLDETLQAINSDYEAKRTAGMALEQLSLRVVPIGTFKDWMKSRGKFGGQNKVPRLSNNRKYIDMLNYFLENKMESNVGS